MKLYTSEPEYKPVKLTITFETKEELDHFASMCNTACIIDSLESGIKLLPIADALMNKGANTSLTEMVTNSIASHPTIRARQ